MFLLVMIGRFFKFLGIGVFLYLLDMFGIFVLLRNVCVVGDDCDVFVFMMDVFVWSGCVIRDVCVVCIVLMSGVCVVVE